MDRIHVEVRATYNGKTYIASSSTANGLVSVDSEYGRASCSVSPVRSNLNRHLATILLSGLLRAAETSGRLRD